MSPQDACPFRRPFAEFFADCPSYRPQLFTPTNCRDEPLNTLWTCLNQTIGLEEDRPGFFYARCMLGDAVARRRLLLERMGSNRAA
jgi:hypothetical protein